MAGRGAPPPAAAPVYVNGATNHGFASTITLTVPGDVEAGDVMVATISTWCSGGGGASISDAAGWDLVDSQTASSSPYGIVTKLYKRVAVGGDAGSVPSWPINNREGRNVAALVAYRGASGTLNASSGAAGSSTAPTAPSVTTTVDNVTLVECFASQNNSSADESTGFTAPGTQRQLASPGTYIAELISDQEQAVAGASGSKVAGLAAGTHYWTAFVVALAA